MNLESKLIIAFVVVLAIAFAGFFFATNYSKDSQSSSVPTLAPANPVSDLKTYNMEEIAKHNSSADCWLLIDQNVYDATQFATGHPGGAPKIYSQCGKDATEAYNTQGGKGTSHPAKADKNLEKLLIGKLQQ